MKSLSKYSGIFARMRRFAEVGLEDDHHEWLKQFSDGKYSSLKELSPADLRAFENWLHYPTVMNNLEHNRLRRAVVGKLSEIGWSPTDTSRWAEVHGAHRERKRFNDYTAEELKLLLGIAKKMVQQYKQKDGRA